MSERVFETEQTVPAGRAEVWRFFSRPENLEAITPPWLRFRIVRLSTPEIREGTLIDYRLRLRGIPIRWRTRIEAWNPPDSFVDVQLRGPYALWHHTHTFHDAAGGGTSIRDRVRYRVPLGALGRLVAGRLVARDVAAIFAFRAERTAELLSATSAPAGG